MLPSLCNDDRRCRPGISKLNLCRDITDSLTDASLEFSPAMHPQVVNPTAETTLVAMLEFSSPSLCYPPQSTMTEAPDPGYPN